MNQNSLNLPEHKQQELNTIVDIICNTQTKGIDAEMILLFGSYARGDFVVRDIVSEDGGTRVYESDFDILVITQKPTQEKNQRLAKEINEQIENHPEITTRASIIIEDIFHVNKMLEEWRYFYVDIKSEGVVLHDSQKYRLKSPITLSSERRKEIQQEDYDLWFEDAKIFFGHYKFDVENTNYKIAAFSLHQATEKFITTYLLVKTGYKPKTHDLEVLYRKIVEEESLFGDIFDTTNEEENRHFELLRKAYIEARYSKTYSITPEELEFLEKKVLILQTQVEQLCQEELS